MDIKKYIKRLDQNTANVLEVVGGYTTEQLTAKTGNEWCILEILEHLLLTDNIIYKLLSRTSGNVSCTKEIIGEKEMHNILVNQRNKKVRSPEPLRPKGNLINIVDFQSGFTAIREKIKAGLITKLIVVDNRIHPHFSIGEMTIADWLNFIISHTDRHLLQIQEQGSI